MRSPEDLSPHPINKNVYGPPTANTAYKDIRASMARNGFDPQQPLLITEDGRILRGCTRWAVAKSLKLEEVPCEVFTPKSPATAELEYRERIISGNLYRVKTQLMLAREQRAMVEIQQCLARNRMGHGGDGGPSKSTDRVGKIFGESGKSVQRRLKVLDAYEDYVAAGHNQKAERLLGFLEGQQITKALELISPASAPASAKKSPRVEVPDTIHARMTKAYSEFFEACAKARVAAEIELLEATLGRMRDDLGAARSRLRAGEASKVPFPTAPEGVKDALARLQDVLS
jgi:hypothetical protein